MSSPLVAPQVKQTDPGHVPRSLLTPRFVIAHVYNIGEITQTVSNRNYILYKTIKFGGTMVAPL